MTDIIRHPRVDEDDEVRFLEKVEIYLETRNGTRLSGVIKRVSEDAILVYQPARGAAVWIRRDDVSLASNKPLWI